MKQEREDQVHLTEIQYRSEGKTEKVYLRYGKYQSNHVVYIIYINKYSSKGVLIRFFYPFFDFCIF